MRIAISPDENPGDPGSVAADGTAERSINLEVAYALTAVLGRCGQDSWFDPNITYAQRVAKANGDGTRLLVACAHNESTSGLSGTQFVFCPGGTVYGNQGPYATSVYAELAKLAGWPKRMPDAIEAIYECCAFDFDTLYIEYLFMSPDDEPLWSAPGYAGRVAEATARGIATVAGFVYVPPPGVPVAAPVDLDRTVPIPPYGLSTVPDDGALHT